MECDCNYCWEKHLRKETTMKTLISQYTNHFGFVIDASGSMAHLTSEVEKVFDAQIARIKRRSAELNQESRVSVFLFDEDIRCLCFDMDVMRFSSLGSLYKTGGYTALLDATGQVLSDLGKVPELYSDHAFLVYVLTDGEENCSRKETAATISRKLTSLPGNWTVAGLVPSQLAKFEAQKFGFPPENIAIWETTAKGLEETSERMAKATDSFLSLRSQGVRSSKSIFSLDLSTVKDSTVKQALDVVPAKSYKTFVAREVGPIKEFVESKTHLPYQRGSAYYKLEKTETIQGGKDILVRQAQSGKVYEGDAARQLLGLPDHDLRVTPGDHTAWDIFVQSTSVNRKLLPGTEIIVRNQ